MILLCHKVPFLDGGSTIKLHDNGSGRQWCYCETCQDLGALDAEGNMYGGATRESCRGSSQQESETQPSLKPELLLTLLTAPPRRRLFSKISNLNPTPHGIRGV
jgi:hypothetical protein